MNKYPKRSDKHVIEKKSISILTDLLPDHWIIRHQSTDDYGIDLEIEFVDIHGNVVGSFFKAQVKGKNCVKRKKNGEISLSGIKISTLNYWMNISKHIHVIVFLIDITTKEIFWTPIFWQASKLIDNSKKTATINFEFQLLPNNKSLKIFIAETYLNLNYERIKAAKWFLNNIERFLQFYDWCNYADFGSLVDDKDFRQILEETSILCCKEHIEKNAPTLNHKHWWNKSLLEVGDPTANYIAAEPINYYFPYIISNIKVILDNILENLTYWHMKDRSISDYAKKLTEIQNNTYEYTQVWVKENSAVFELYY